MECLPPPLEGAPSIQESGRVFKQVAGEHFAILCDMNPFKVPLFETLLETRCTVFRITNARPRTFPPDLPDLGQTGKLPKGSGFEDLTAICLLRLFAISDL